MDDRNHQRSEIDDRNRLSDGHSESIIGMEGRSWQSKSTVGGGDHQNPPSKSTIEIEHRNRPSKSAIQNRPSKNRLHRRPHDSALAVVCQVRKTQKPERYWVLYDTFPATNLPLWTGNVRTTLFLIYHDSPPISVDSGTCALGKRTNKVRKKKKKNKSTRTHEGGASKPTDPIPSSYL